MKYVPSAPVMSGALSGFVVGVFVALIATGVISRGPDSSSPVPTIAPPVHVSDPLLYQQVKKIIVNKLGPSQSNPKEQRFISLELRPAAPRTSPPILPDNSVSLRTVYVEFHLYDNPLGRSWRLRSAQADIFAIMKALYTSQLPIYDVRLDGIFPMLTGRVTKDQIALIASINNGRADRIPWKRWNRKQETTLWNTLTYRWVDPRFA